MSYHNKSPISIKEEMDLGFLLTKHPTILLKGPSATGVQRTLDALVSLHLDRNKVGEIESVYKNNHPDVFWVDGRDLKADQARELRGMATTRPARWNRKYMILTHLDRPHPVVVPILLKVVEEPPEHFSTILITDNLKGIPPTIPSRALQMRITLPKVDEIEELLEKRGFDEPTWRANVCGGDYDVATNLDVPQTRTWQKLWSASLSGGDLPYDFPSTWTDNFTRKEDQTGVEETQTACWEILIKIAAIKVHESIYWREIAQMAMKARNRSRLGNDNKSQITNTLIQCYAQAKTAARRKR
jgi:hypothetical protein